MKTLELPLAELVAIGGTRAILGAGIALLLGAKLAAPARMRMGWTLVAIGALSTVPLGRDVLKRMHQRDRLR